MIKRSDGSRITYDMLVEINRKLMEEIKNKRDLIHSEQFVVMFMGYLTADIPELHVVEPPKILESWDKFKLEMGKKT